VKTSKASDHLVWAEGPNCDENCPGETSQWHDGYAWGTEKVGKRLASAWTSKAKLQRSILRMTYQREARRTEAYRLAGVGMMAIEMPNGDERVTIAVPGGDKRKRIEAEVLSDLRAEIAALPRHTDPDAAEWLYWQFINAIDRRLGLG
jgi:hypothetical protein